MKSKSGKAHGFELDERIDIFTLKEFAHAVVAEIRAWQAIVLSTCISITSVVLGLVLAFLLDLPASGSIVLLSFLAFGILFVFRRARG